MERLKAQKKRPLPLLFGGIGLLGVAAYIVFGFPPTFVIPVGPVSFSLIIPFFVVLYAAVYCITAFAGASAVQGIIVASFTVGYMIMRLFGLTHVLFAILLLGVLGSIEFAIYKKK
jgi:hypothetical protein